MKTSELETSEQLVIDIQSDSTVAPGDCRIETGDKGLLASLEAFLAAASQHTSMNASPKRREA